MAVFNKATPNVPALRYYSYGSTMVPDPVQHPLLVVSYAATSAGALFHGYSVDNDGLVTIDSQKWGTWMGGPETSWYVTGIDHAQICNFLWTGQSWYDVEGFFFKVAQNANQ